MNRWVVLGAVIVLGFLVIGFLYEPQRLSTISEIFSKEYRASSIRVISGSEFDLQLTDGRRIHARLRVDATPESREKVIRLINESSNPQVSLDGNDGKLWVVEISLNHPIYGRYKLSEWLIKNGLAWVSPTSLQQTSPGVQ